MEAFLLCYDCKYPIGLLHSLLVWLGSSSEFGTYADRHGTLINDCVAVDCEEVAEHFSYGHHPHVLLLSRSFVEVRHAASGNLEQIIRSSGI